MALQIRRTVYRNREGFLICGRCEHSGIFGTRIFTLTRPSAERIRDKVKVGQEITTADFHE